MSEPAPPPQSPPSPFDRPGGQAPISPGRPGVRKPLLLGCGALLALLGVTMVLFVVYQDAIATWMFEAMHAELESKLPEDLPPDVRARYQDAFELAVASAREGDYDATDLQRVQREFTRLAGESRMSVEEVERLTGILEEIPDRGE
ncbi:MAG TPA: hypothetical protein VJG13_00220 [Thermoanaerobaculia bacterium]|nr:hypothetical protein [Thermoanaerobaculia bacterium]